MDRHRRKFHLGKYRNTPNMTDYTICSVCGDLALNAARVALWLCAKGGPQRGSTLIQGQNIIPKLILTTTSLTITDSGSFQF